jgi:hypothetical protein
VPVAVATGQRPPCLKQVKEASKSPRCLSKSAIAKKSSLNRVGWRRFPASPIQNATRTRPGGRAKTLQIPTTIFAKEFPMKIKTNLKCGGRQLNHNQTLKTAAGMPVKTSVKCGGRQLNHNQTLKA